METSSDQAWREKGLLNSLLYYPQILRQNSNLITSDLFDSPANGMIFDAIAVLAKTHDANQRIGFQELAEYLYQMGQLEDCGGREYLDMIDDLENVPGAVAWRMYFDAMVTNRQIRYLTRTVERLANLPNRVDQIEEIKSILKIINLPSAPKHLVSTQEALEQILLDPDQDVARPNLIKFGIPKLDAMLNLAEPGKVITIGAATSGGKTSLACQCVRESQVASLIYTLEMSWRDIWDRMLVGDSAINYNNYIQKRLLSDERQRLGRSIEQFRRGQTIWIDAEPPIRMEDIESAAESLSDQGLRLLVVDYLQLLTPESKKREVSREQEVAELSRRLKLLAGKLDLIVISLSQLNDQGKVRESRAIAQDSDVVILIELGEEESHLNLWKQRTGRTGKVPIVFDSERMRFIPK